MIAVIPFVAKVLEPCRGSRIFAPPNPWSSALLGLIAEIYSERDLKLNLKFEVERLFKHLDLPLKDFPASQLLAGRLRERAGNPDFVADKPPPGPGAAAGPVGAPGMPLPTHLGELTLGAGAPVLGARDSSAGTSQSYPSSTVAAAAAATAAGYKGLDGTAGAGPEPPKPFVLSESSLLANLQVPTMA